MIEESVAVKRATLELCEASIARAAEVVIETFRNGGKLLTFGNGGSAADAQHLAAELAFSQSGYGHLTIFHNYMAGQQ